MEKALTVPGPFTSLHHGLIIAVLLIGLHPWAAHAEESTSPCLSSFFTDSLHFRGEGMRYWYEEAGGFMQLTGIPYRQLDCKTCHVKSCDQCHAVQKGEKWVFSEKKAKGMNTCLPCHSREGLTFKYDGQSGKLDVHIAAGMVCSDCHYRSDVHGDGRERVSMRHPKAVRATCKECHVEQARESPVFDADSPHHKVHGNKLDCAACHVQNTVACYNCHFDSFLKTGKREGAFIPMKDWTLLVNYDGKVTSGSAMALVHQNKKFISYVPYFTHSISSTGRGCDECHANAAVQLIEKGQKVPVVDFKNGQPVPWQGVVPIVENMLEWAFLNKTDTGWAKVAGDTPPVVQFACFGAPLSREQLERLKEKQTPQTDARPQ